MSTAKEERVARLAAAREKRLRDNPPAYKEYSQWVVNLPDDDTYSFRKHVLIRQRLTWHIKWAAIKNAPATRSGTLMSPSWKAI